NFILIFGALAALKATLTLPGIAGIVLIIGMAVDANVLIFERTREEIRLGKPPRSAVKAGYGKALSTIIDANVTTLIAALVLFQFGTGPVRGFAVTLSLGIICSMFTAIFVTRIIFDYFIWYRRIQRVRI
ncbi:MAG: MMPL family transporter, partial [Syntrophales bacterium]|nr:MMPL family transporter [Syntrophales bacterium]